MSASPSDPAPNPLRAAAVALARASREQTTVLEGVLEALDLVESRQRGTTAAVVEWGRDLGERADAAIALGRDTAEAVRAIRVSVDTLGELVHGLAASIRDRLGATDEAIGRLAGEVAALQDAPTPRPENGRG